MPFNRHSCEQWSKYWKLFSSPSYKKMIHLQFIWQSWREECFVIAIVKDSFNNLWSVWTVWENWTKWVRILTARFITHFHVKYWMDWRQNVVYTHRNDVFFRVFPEFFRTNERTEVCTHNNNTPILSSHILVVTKLKCEKMVVVRECTRCRFHRLTMHVYIIFVVSTYHVINQHTQCWKWKDID